METASLFVDGANWTKAQEELFPDRRINYDKIVRAIELVARVQISGLYYYTAFRTKSDLNHRWAFLEVLKDNGWQVQAIPAEQDTQGRWRDKEVDIAMALDAYEEARSGRARHILIGSGDGDFAALFRRLPDEIGRWVVIFEGYGSKILREVANVIDLQKLGIFFPPR